MLQSGTLLPQITWGEMEAIFDDLAITPNEKTKVETLLLVTRSLSDTLSPMDLFREIICIALVLTPASDRPPEPPSWDFLNLPGRFSSG